MYKLFHPVNNSTIRYNETVEMQIVSDNMLTKLDPPPIGKAFLQKKS